MQIKLAMPLASTRQHVTKYPFTVLKIMRAPRQCKLIPRAPFVRDSCPHASADEEETTHQWIFKGLLMCKAESEMVSKA